MQLSVALLVFAGIAAAQGEIDCPDGKLTPEQRQLFLDRHNLFRSRLAKGLETGKDGSKLPKAKNMFKLNYSCELENGAQKYADKCQLKFSRSKEYGENIVLTGYAAKLSSRGTVDVESLYKRVPEDVTTGWWENKQHYTINPHNIYDRANKGAKSFTQIAWGSTYALGCGIARHCHSQISDGTLVVCRYAKKGNIVGQQIYELGDPCTKDDDCLSKKCSPAEGLCIKQ